MFVRYLGRHVQCVEANPAAAVDVGVINGSYETDLGRFERVSVWHVDLELESTPFVRRA